MNSQPASTTLQMSLLGILPSNADKIIELPSYAAQKKQTDEAEENSSLEDVSAAIEDLGHREVEN